MKFISCARFTTLAAAALVMTTACGQNANSAPAQARAPGRATEPSAPADAKVAANLRKTLAERLPTLPPIDEVNAMPIAGIYELRLGSDIYYADASGRYLIDGAIFDTQTKVDLTQTRTDKLSAIIFAKLPLGDAITIKQGDGSRNMAVFADPNCGYCKRLEKDLLKLKDVTIHTFLLPVLGPDSTAKSRDIWCAKEPAKTWRAWMIDAVTPPKTDPAAACDTAALARNTALGRKHRISGTPAIIFEDNTRAPGALPLEQIEKALATAAAAKK